VENWGRDGRCQDKTHIALDKRQSGQTSRQPTDNPDTLGKTRKKCQTKSLGNGGRFFSRTGRRKDTAIDTRKKLFQYEPGGKTAADEDRGCGAM